MEPLKFTFEVPESAAGSRDLDIFLSGFCQTFVAFRTFCKVCKTTGWLYLRESKAIACIAKQHGIHGQGLQGCQGEQSSKGGSIYLQVSTDM